MGISVRDLLREKGTPYADLGLGDAKWTDDQLIDFMLQHPILINRPIVVSPLGVKLCRPSEDVLDPFPSQQRRPFTNADRQRVIDAAAKRLEAGEPSARQQSQRTVASTDILPRSRRAVSHRVALSARDALPPSPPSPRP